MDNNEQKVNEEWRKNWEHLDSEGRARKFLESIEEGGQRALKFEKLTDDDRETIKKGLARLPVAFRHLCRAFIEPLRETNPSLVDYGYEKLWAILGWTWALGAKGHVPESAEPFLQSQRAKKPRPQNPIDEKIMEGLRKGRPRHSIANELKLPDKDAFKQRVSRVKKRMEKIS